MGSKSDFTMTMDEIMNLIGRKDIAAEIKRRKEEQYIFDENQNQSLDVRQVIKDLNQSGPLKETKMKLNDDMIIEGEIEAISRKNFSILVNDQWFKVSKDMNFDELEQGQYIKFITRHSTSEWNGNTRTTWWANRPKITEGNSNTSSSNSGSTESSGGLQKADDRSLTESSTDLKILFGQVLNAVMAKTLDPQRIKKGVNLLFPEVLNLKRSILNTTIEEARQAQADMEPAPAPKAAAPAPDPVDDLLRDSGVSEEMIDKMNEVDDSDLPF